MVFGASEHIAIRYDEPKEFDGTPLQAQKFDKRCRQIAREMLYVISSSNT